MMASRTPAGEEKSMIIGWNRIRKAVQLECLPSSIRQFILWTMYGY